MEFEFSEGRRSNKRPRAEEILLDCELRKLFIRLSSLFLLLQPILHLQSSFQFLGQFICDAAAIRLERRCELSRGMHMRHPPAALLYASAGPQVQICQVRADRCPYTTVMREGARGCEAIRSRGARRPKRKGRNLQAGEDDAFLKFFRERCSRSCSETKNGK